MTTPDPPRPRGRASWADCAPVEVTRPAIGSTELASIVSTSLLVSSADTWSAVSSTANPLSAVVQR